MTVSTGPAVFVVLLLRSRCEACGATGLNGEDHTCGYCQGTGIDNHGA